MKQSWVDYDEAAEKGPIPLFWKVLVAVLLIFGVTGTIGYALGWFTEAASVVKDEFGPREALRKYTWMKEASAQLEKKQADIKVYDRRITQMNETYKETKRISWPREDREQMNVWSSEVAGIKASYNQLAGEYNAKMAEVQWSFAEVGKLPPGSNTPLPREFKPYIEE